MDQSPPRPRFIPEAAFAQLLANGQRAAGGDGFDPPPVIKLFTPDANATWLLTKVDPDDHDRAFGLCDLGLGMPELGWVSLNELTQLRGRFDLPIECDAWFKPDRPLSAYATSARQEGRILT